MTPTELSVDSQSGFSLIELLLALGIASILAGIAMPIYREYTERTAISEAITQLQQLRLRLEQYYQDNRQYGATGKKTDCGITMPTGKYFDYTCTTENAAQAYTLKADGTKKKGMQEFIFTINEKGDERTESIPKGWGRAPLPCWILKKNMLCQ